jgi:predicted nucleic acid-binding protein
LRICVDTTILIDILKDEFRPFQEKLYEAME